MQRAGQLGQVVGVGGAAGHVQHGRFVRQADAHARAGVLRAAFAGDVQPLPLVGVVVGKGSAQQMIGNEFVHGDFLKRRHAA
jgi:hypothetical protein